MSDKTKLLIEENKALFAFSKPIVFTMGFIFLETHKIYMNTNVGDMPLDIFCDYVSDTLGQEWCWEYFALVVNNGGYSVGNGFGHGSGYGTGSYHRKQSTGNGNGYGYIENYGQIYGRENGLGEGYSHKQLYVILTGFGFGHKGCG